MWRSHRSGLDTPANLHGHPRDRYGEVTIEVPRDRNGTLEPQIVKKRQMRFDGFDEKILSRYARGMTTRDIQGHLEEIYGVKVSPSLISNVTDAVVEEVKAWQSRPLEAVYPILYLDALHVKMREGLDNRFLAPALITTILLATEVRFGLLESPSRTLLAIGVRSCSISCWGG